MPGKPAPLVFIDANLIIQGGKPPGGPLIARVMDLAKADLIQVLTTDLSIDEVAKKHAENDYEVIREIGRPHFRKLVEEVVGVKLPAKTKAELRGVLASAYTASTKAMFDSLQATTISIDEVKPTTVFQHYRDKTGLFSGEGKKDQFPDAFIFECIRIKAAKETPVIIVSEDGDFSKPVAGEKHITLVASITQLFKHLGLQVDAPVVGTFLERQHDALVAAVDSELSDWGLVGDVEDSDIEETDVTDVTITKLTSFGSVEEGDPILVVAELEAKVNVSYSHPNWDEAMYDSEDKRLIPFESVSGETELTLELDVSMSIAVDDEGEPEEIDALSFRNNDFQYVELHPYDPYEYM